MVQQGSQCGEGRPTSCVLESTNWQVLGVLSMWLDHATPGRMPERVGESVLLARLIAVGNLLMRALLRSRLHPLVDKDLMILTVTGRKTGTQYRIPLSYIRDGDVITCFADRTVTRANWVKNLRDGAPVTMLVQGKHLAGFAEISTGVANADAERAFLTRIPRDAVFHRVKRGPDGQFDQGDLERAAARSVMVRITLG